MMEGYREDYWEDYQENYRESNGAMSKQDCVKKLMPLLKTGVESSPQMWLILLIGILGMLGAWQSNLISAKYSQRTLNPAHLGLNNPAISESILKQAGEPKIPSVREAAAAAKSYKESIKALETPKDLSDNEIKEQGFVIRPIEGFRIQKNPMQTTQSDVPAPKNQFNNSIAQLSKNTQNEAKRITQRARETIENFSASYITSNNSLNSKGSPQINNSHYYSMDATNRSLLLTNAKNLTTGTPRTLAKRILGKPTKETIIALPETGDLAKMLVYTIKLWRQGVSTPEKDEKLILVFDSSDSLLSMEINAGTADAYQNTQISHLSKDNLQSYPKIASSTF